MTCSILRHSWSASKSLIATISSNISSTAISRKVAAPRSRSSAATVRLTYEELADQVNRLGNGLRDLGLQEEQRVLLVLPDIPEFAVAYFGAMKIGAVAVPTSTALRAADYAYFLEESRSRVAIVHSTLLAEFTPALSRQRHCKHVIVCGEASAGVPPLERGLDQRITRAWSGSDAARTTSRSGSGRPAAPGGRKPPCTLHRRLELLLRVLRPRACWTSVADDVTFSSSKLFHAYGLGNGLMFPVSCRRNDGPLPGQAAGKNDSGCRAIGSANTVLFSADTLCRDAPGSGAERGPRPRVRSPVGVGGRTAACRDFSALEGAFRSRDSRRHRIDRGVAHLPLGAGRSSSPWKHGRKPFRDTSSRSSITQASRCPPGTIGDLMVAGPSTASCYWNRQTLTRDRMRGRWFFTGDKY